MQLMNSYGSNKPKAAGQDCGDAQSVLSQTKAIAMVSTWRPWHRTGDCWNPYTVGTRRDLKLQNPPNKLAQENAQVPPLVLVALSSSA